MGRLAMRGELSRIGLGIGVVAAISLGAASAHAQTPTAAPAAAPAAPAAAPAAPAAAPPAAAAPPPMAAPAAAPPPVAATAPAPSAAPPTTATEAPKSDDDFPPGVLGPKMRIGPLLGAGISPRPLNIGVFLNYDKMFGLGLSYNFLPGFTVDSASVSAYQIELDARWFPFHGSFFLGAGLGYQSLNASATDGLFTVEAAVKGPYVTPRLGWLWMWDSGITFGLDFGVALPLGSSTSLTENGVDLLGQLNDTQNNVKKAGDLIGGTPLPDIKLRLGYLF